MSARYLKHLHPVRHTVKPPAVPTADGCRNGRPDQAPATAWKPTNQGAPTR